MKTGVIVSSIALGALVVSSTQAQVSGNAVQRARQAREKLASTRPARAAQNAVPMTGQTGGGARNVTSRASMGGLSQALQAFVIDTGRLPTTSESLSALLVAPTGARNWRGPYIAVSSGRPPFTDPWGNLYRYTNTTNGYRQSYEIRSLGPDGVLNTRDDLFVQF